MHAIRLVLQGFLLMQVASAVFTEDNILDSEDELLEDSCSFVVCRAGRECRVSNGEASCVCQESCPDHFVPVCGSNNQSYDNYCQMHRDACLSGIHISLKHKGYCTKKPLKSSKKQKERNSSFEPVVCFQWERDTLRKHIISHFNKHAADQSWYRPDLKTNEKNWGRFYTCDTSKDNFLDANEFLTCVQDVPFALRSTTTSSELVKALCVDAIVDAADANSDWRLDFEEFKQMADPHFRPKEKLCSLEGKKYEDGSQTKVDCNDCVCACGSWVCTSKTCKSDSADQDEDDSIFDDDADQTDYDDNDDTKKSSITLVDDNDAEDYLKQKYNVDDDFDAKNEDDQDDDDVDDL